MKKNFIYEFDDVSDENMITFDGDDGIMGQFKFEVDEKNNINLYADKAGYAYFAKLFIKLAKGNFSEGFHIHTPCDSEDVDMPRQGPEINFFVSDKSDF